MDGSAALTFKVACEEWEFEQIHRLNYRTFAEEIPQHAANGRGELVDRFHEANVYVVGVRGRELLGMVALRFDRPFSVEQKVADFEGHLPPGPRRMVEIRLLAAEKRHRGGRVLMGLVREAS